MKNNFKGGMSANMTAFDVAKKWKISPIEFMPILEKGTEHEMEHTDNEDIARRIALDHIVERLDYYDKLEEIEKMKKGAVLETPTTLNDIVLYYEKKGNWLFAKGNFYAWLYDASGVGKKVESGEYDFIMFPPMGKGSPFSDRYVPPLLMVWQKTYQKNYKGSEHLLGIVKGFYDEDKNQLIIEMMTTNPKFRRQGINAHLIKQLRTEFGVSQEDVIFDKPTKQGKLFEISKKYNLGGEMDRNFNDKELLRKYKNEESIGFTAIAHLKSKGLIPRADGQKRKSEKYMEDGGLIAPNGKESNLTPEQYKLVRTKAFKDWFGDWENDPTEAFKDWFGDWENDPENSSKVVDENGEPLVMYHGTQNTFTIFEMDYIETGIDDKELKSRFWFTKNKELAESYSRSRVGDSKVYEVFLNIRKPKNNDFNLYTEDDNDGVIEYNGRKNISVAIVTSSNQIKLADGTNTTFNGNNPDIRFANGGENLTNKELMANDFVNEQKELQRNSKYAILLDATYSNYTNEMREVYRDLQDEITKKLGYNPLVNYSPLSDNVILTFDDDSNLLGALEFTIEPQYTEVPRYSPSYIKPEPIFENNNNVFFIEYLFSFAKGNGQKIMNKLKQYAHKYNVDIGLYGSVVYREDQDKFMASDKHLQRFYDKQGFINVIGHYFLYSPNSMAKGGRTIAQTPAPASDRVSGSKTNPKGSASDTSLARSIKFNDSLLKAIENKVKAHNEEYPSKKVTTPTAKAVVRRGMGAYSKSHRPFITGGAPNSRQAWGLARLNKFLLKKRGVKVKSAYIQDDDLL